MPLGRESRHRAPQPDSFMPQANSRGIGTRNRNTAMKTCAKLWKSGTYGLNDKFLGPFLASLDAEVLSVCACVCKKWRERVRESEGWLRQAVREFGERAVVLAGDGGGLACQDVYKRLLADPGIPLSSNMLNLARDEWKGHTPK